MQNHSQKISLLIGLWICVRVNEVNNHSGSVHMQRGIQNARGKEYENFDIPTVNETSKCIKIV